MTEKEATKQKRERFSWHVNLDKSLRTPCRVASDAAKLEVREFLSLEIEKILYGGNTATG